MIKIHPPTGEYMDFTELLPYPCVHFPIKVGDVYTLNHTISSQNLEIDGIEVNGTLKVAGKVLYKEKMLADSCWVIECKNENGNYLSQYYFNEGFGFVYFFYKDTNHSIEINLESLELQSFRD